MFAHQLSRAMSISSHVHAEHSTRLAHRYACTYTQVWVRVSVADGGRIRAPPLVFELLHPTDAAVPSNHTPQPLDVKRASLASAEAEAASVEAAAVSVPTDLVFPID